MIKKALGDDDDNDNHFLAQLSQKNSKASFLVGISVTSWDQSNATCKIITCYINEIQNRTILASNTPFSPFPLILCSKSKKKYDLQYFLLIVHVNFNAIVISESCSTKSQPVSYPDVFLNG